MTVHTSSKQLVPNLQRSAMNMFTPVQRELDRVFDQLASGWSAFNDFGLTPRMDMVESDAAIEMTFELPGLAQGDVKIAIEDDVLTVSGEKKAESEAKDKDRRVIERSYGAFERSITLPRNVDAAKIKATMADGVLKVVVPKTPGAKPKTIEIQPGK